MKKTILLFSIFILLNISGPELNASRSLFAQPEKGFVITVTAANAGKGYLYISRRIDGKWKNLDSVMIKITPVVMKGRLEVPELLYLRSSGSGTMVPFFGENSNIVVYADFNDPSKSTVSGSAIHNEYQVYCPAFLYSSISCSLFAPAFKKPA